MKPNKPFETYQNRVAQFEQSEKLNQGPITPPKKQTGKKPIPSLSTENPYLQARLKVLSSYPKWRQNEIAEMERLNDINNQHYDAFVHDVAVAGDMLMPI